jgi:hypothetical protein
MINPAAPVSPAGDNSGPAEAEEARVNRTLAALSSERLAELVSQAVADLPAPIVRRNPTIANPFVRAKVFELAGG